MGKKKALARRAREEAAAAEAAAALRASRTFRRHFFTTADQTPKLRTPLQRAIYSGRTTRVRLLTSCNRNPYALTERRLSPLFLAIARDQPAIAHHLLDLLEGGPLFGLRYYLQMVEPHPQRCLAGGAADGADWWLRQPILVAFDREQCEFVYELAAGMTVPAGECVPADEPGLLVVCQHNNQSPGDVLWLRPRTRADGRRVARIVARCYADGGDVTLNRHEWRGMSWFDAAVWMRLPTVWWRMYEMFGAAVLPPLSAVLQLWQLADDRSEFERFLQRAGIDLARAMGADATLGPQLVGCGASFGSVEILEWVLELAVAAGADRSAVLDAAMHGTLFSPCERMAVHCLLDLGLDHGRVQLTQWRWFVDGRPFDERISEWLLKGGGGYVDDDADEMLCALVQNNWWSTVRAICDRRGAEQPFTHHANAVDALRTCLDRSHDDMSVYVLHTFAGQFTADDRDELLQRLLVRREWTDAPADLSRQLLTPAMAADAARVGRLMFACLDNWRTESFDEHWRLAQRVVDSDGIVSFDVRGLRNADGDSLLAAAIFDRHRWQWHRQEAKYQLPPPAEAALELSDSDDSDAEEERKAAWNRERTAVWRLSEAELSEGDVVGAAYRRIFDRLLAAGCDADHVNGAGETLLHCAVGKDCAATVRRLLHDCSAETTIGFRGQAAKTTNGDTALHFVRSAAVFDLLQSSALVDVHAANDDGQTPLHCALSSGGQRLAATRRLPLVEQLRSAPVDTTLISRLLAAGADANARDLAGNTPLLAAASCSADVWRTVCTEAPQPLDLLARSADGQTLLARLLHSYDAQMPTVLRDLVAGSARLRHQFAELFERQADEQDHERLVGAPYQFNEYCRQRCGVLTARGFWRPEHVRGRRGALALEAYAYEMPDTLDAVRVVAALVVAGVNYWREPAAGGGGERPAPETSRMPCEWSSPLEGTLFECLLSIAGEENDESGV